MFKHGTWYDIETLPEAPNSKDGDKAVRERLKRIFDDLEIMSIDLKKESEDGI